MPQDLKTHYAIVGAGVAGVAAAEAIREADPSRALLLINGEPVPPYCRPLIIETLTGERSSDEIHLRSPQWYEEKTVSLVTGDPAVALNPRQKRLSLASGRSIAWEKLLLATGSKPAVPSIRGIDEVPAFTLYCQDDVTRLKSMAKPGAKALLIGIGLIGLQGITALKELGVDVVAVELMHKVLPLILDAQAAGYAQQRLEANGVEVRTGSSITELALAEGAKHRYMAVIDAGDTVEFDFLIVATGMKPDLSLLSDWDVESDRGIRVSPRMETSIPGIYAAGDITEYRDWIEDRPEIHAHWVNAFHQGRVAGLHMAGRDTEPYEPVFVNALDVFGLPIITMGASRIDVPEGADVYISEAPERPAYRRLVVKNGRLVAATFVDDVDPAGMFQHLIREKVTIGPVAESLLEQGREGMEFLHELHEKVIRGDVDWPASMDAIDRYKKDHKHTRWGKEEGRP